MCQSRYGGPYTAGHLRVVPPAVFAHLNVATQQIHKDNYYGYLVPASKPLDPANDLKRHYAWRRVRNRCTTITGRAWNDDQRRGVFGRGSNIQRL